MYPTSLILSYSSAILASRDHCLLTRHCDTCNICNIVSKCWKTLVPNPGPRVPHQHGTIFQLDPHLISQARSLFRWHIFMPGESCSVICAPPHRGAFCSPLVWLHPVRVRLRQRECTSIDWLHKLSCAHCTNLFANAMPDSRSSFN